MENHFFLNCRFQTNDIIKMGLVAYANNVPVFQIIFKPISSWSTILYKEILTTGDAIHRVNKILKSLNTEIPIKFESFTQYNNLLQSIAKELDIPYS